ncbi:MAG: hypothetical protein CME65_10940 [Halobacteriovoraceae bacterium]|nr:hypothetical protein [Halobacteriovoraceae bacterium]|tara:strand:+ start:3509 stop:3748 length:240 start_codon:yes stop_codon:yes gene_type:complete
MSRLFVLLAMFSVSVMAQSDQKGPSRGENGHPRPPKEALEACKSLKSGDSCKFTTQRGDESGTCFTPSSDKRLACKPNR